jgi:SAM-dependent methyltransferase
MNTTRIKRIFCLAATLAAAAAQDRHPVSGRVIAPVMGMGGASWLARAERQTEEDPERAIKLLNFKPGMTVADIGAGVGYYALRIAPLVGPEGKVFATDIQPGMIRLLKENIAKAGIKNIEPVLVKSGETGVPDGAIDLALMVDVYHELSQPQEMLRAISKALRPTGRLVLIEFREEDPAVPIRAEHKMSVKTVRVELEAEGYVLDQSIPGLPWQHLLVFKRK